MEINTITTEDNTKTHSDGLSSNIETRREFWKKLSLEQRIKLQENKKDPVIYEAYQLYLKLKEFFD